MPKNILSIPLSVLALLASYLTGGGLTFLWVSETAAAVEPVVTYVTAAALHAAWILPALMHRRLALVAVGWLVSLDLCSGGLAAAGFDAGATLNAFLLEFVILSLALAHAPVTPWPNRIAQWRRTRERITTELRIGQGLLPWARSAWHRFFAGQADRPLSTSFDRIVADLADHEDRMRRTIASLSLPEAVRESLHTAAQAIVSDAEVTTARTAMELERRALDQAATCRDAILALEDMPDAERDRLARECESLMLELAHSVGTMSPRPSAVQPMSGGGNL